jgi:predicted acyl esterase
VGPTHPTGLIAGLLGYATVGVNLRGTACSGGAYDFFETLQLLDGYDVIEAIAAQDWVLHNKVGMVGLSFPGISTLFVARARPPSLAAITPLSVLANTVVSTLSPGGILNDGFALEWGQQVLDRAAPFGHGWEADRVAVGDTVCEENQLLHSQKVDIIELARSNPFYPPDLADPLAPELFADRIQVPVFTSGAWQDEQTGGHFPALWDDFVNAPIARFQAFNGAHADGLAPHTLIEWKVFLDFYVARERLPLDPVIPGLTSLLFEQIFGARVTLPVERQEEIDAYATFEEALAAYEAEQPVRILFESGGTPFALGAPETTFELRFPSWPPPQTEPRRWWLHEDGSLRDFEPSEAESASLFRHDPAKGRETLTTLDGGPAPASFLWNAWLPDRQAVFVSDPLDQDLVMVGHGSADLWVRSGTEEAELEVVLSEVRPDGLEMYVQSGWLRASQRALAPDATPLRPVKTHLEQDAAPLPADDFNLARVEIFPFGHVFRAGSRIRLSVETPGGNRARWQFQLTDYGEDVRHAIAHSAAYPSSVLLPVIPDVAAPGELPPCQLRSQPCRPFVEHLNLRLD